jgi:hypothetical protein
VFLDDYKIESLTLQIQYVTSYEIWDKAGEIARELTNIWPDLELVDGQPQLQTLTGKSVQVQTGHRTSNITLASLKSIDAQTMERLTQAFKVWRAGLSLDKLSRLSTRAIYTRKYPTLGEANKALRDLNLVNWPGGKMFDQPEAGWQNVPDILFRFEDEKSFSFLRFKTEQLKFESKAPVLFDIPDTSLEIDRLVVDFDRGILGSINADVFMMDKWLEGFQHVLRRDIEKIVGAQK